MNSMDGTGGIACVAPGSRGSAALKAAAGARHAPSTRERAQGLERENRVIPCPTQASPSPTLPSPRPRTCLRCRPRPQAPETAQCTRGPKKPPGWPASSDWRKVASVVGMAMLSMPDRPSAVPDVFFAKRVALLAESGRLESQGETFGACALAGFGFGRRDGRMRHKLTLTPTFQYSPSSMRHVLFICSRNRLRSPTAAGVFAGPHIETDSAGLAPDADCILSAEQLEWADLIFVMEKQHRAKLKQRFAGSLRGKKVVCLDIPDRYQFMQPELVELLHLKVGQYLRQWGTAAKDAT